MKIVRFKDTDMEAVVSLFYETVHSICLGDYSQEEVNAWAPAGEWDCKVKKWRKSLNRNITFVAKDNDKLVGFGDITHHGDLDRLYVHQHYQGQHIATAIVEKLEAEARKLNLAVIETEASITAKAFFESRGYEIVRAQNVVRHGVPLTNFKMMKQL